MARLMFSLSLLSCLIASGAVVTTTSSPAEKGESWNSYRTILTRNIFSRDRAVPSKARLTTRPAAAKSQEQSLVLTGIIMQGCEHVAFFEDTRVGETVRACAGDPLASGVIASLSLDSLEYQTAEGVRCIEIGENLVGQASLLSATTEPAEPTAAASSEPSASRPSASPEGGSAGGASVLERMRLRRQQDLK